MGDRDDQIAPSSIQARARLILKFGRVLVTSLIGVFAFMALALTAIALMIRFQLLLPALLFSGGLLTLVSNNRKKNSKLAKKYEAWLLNTGIDGAVVQSPIGRTPVIRLTQIPHESLWDQVANFEIKISSTGIKRTDPANWLNKHREKMDRFLDSAPQPIVSAQVAPAEPPLLLPPAEIQRRNSIYRLPEDPYSSLQPKANQSSLSRPPTSHSSDQLPQAVWFGWPGQPKVRR